MPVLPTGRALLDPYKILEESGIRGDMNVADLGVGAVGHFLFPAAKMVGAKGRVYAVDILKSVLQANQNRAKVVGADNIDYVWGDIERLGGTKLAAGSMDLVLMVNVVHLTKKGQTLAEVKRVLKDGGSLAIVDWRPGGGGAVGPAVERRISKDDARDLAVAAGLVLKKEFEAGPSHYGLVFTKPSA